MIYEDKIVTKKYPKDDFQVIHSSLKKGIRIIIAGLHKDYLNNKFESVDALMKEADVITRLHATGNQCGGIGIYSHRITHQKSKILLGHKNHYEPLCKICYTKIINVR